ncbi:MAG: hypothetical protein AAF203_10120 [Pseudomonadota bacterium]
MKYKLLLFDLDDTLLNFKASQEKAFQKTLDNLSAAPRMTELYPLYLSENKKCWDLLEKGEITKQKLQETRFEKVAQEVGTPLHGAQVNDIYMDFLPESVVLEEGALEVCQTLAKKKKSR